MLLWQLTESLSFSFDIYIVFNFSFIFISANNFLKFVLVNNNTEKSVIFIYCQV